MYCTPAGKCYQLIIKAFKSARIKHLIDNLLQERGRVIYDSLPQNFARVHGGLDEKAGGIVVVEDI